MNESAFGINGSEKQMRLVKCWFCNIKVVFFLTGNLYMWETLNRLKSVLAIWEKFLDKIIGLS
jgi:hypothetical protein